MSEPRPPQQRPVTINIEFTHGELKNLRRWRDRVGLKSTVAAIRLAMRAGLTAMSYEPRPGDAECHPLTIRIPSSLWRELSHSANSNQRSIRAEVLVRLEKSTMKPEKEKGGATASETSSAPVATQSTERI